MTGAFAPATVFALMETAVYNSIDDSIDRDVKHGVSSACSLVLEVLANNDPTLLRNEDSRLKSWRAGKKKEQRLPLMVQGIHGLLAFIGKADEGDIQGWPPKDRNGLSHNGIYINAMYKTPEKPIGGDYTATKEEVKSKTVYFADEAKNVDTLESLQSLDTSLLEKKLKDKLSELVTAVCAKVGVSVDAACLEDVEKFLLGLRGKKCKQTKMPKCIGADGEAHGV